MDTFKYLSTILLLLSFYNLRGQNIIVRPYLQDLGKQKVSILWEADASGTGQVVWGSSPFQLDSVSNSQTVSINGSSWVHTCTIDQVKSNTKYYYRVQMPGGQQSFVYHFKTLP